MESVALFAILFLGGIFLAGVAVVVLTIINFNSLKNLEGRFWEVNRKLKEQTSILEEIRRHFGVEPRKETASASELKQEPVKMTPVALSAPATLKPEGEKSIMEKQSFASTAVSVPASYGMPPENKPVSDVKRTEAVPASVSGQEMKSEVSERISEFSRKTNEALERIVQWLCVGEEFRNPKVSPEYAVATTWLVRVGVLILLFGVVFFMKYSIDNNLIRPEVRIAASFLAGVGMVAGGLYTLKGRYQGVASGIMGVGFVTCYLSVFFAYKTFALIPYGSGFAAMLAVVAAADVIAIWKNQLLPAVIGTLGGYAVPILLSRGTMDLPGLFTFASLLSVFVLLGAAIRSWRILHLLAFSFNALIYIAAGMKVGFSNYKLCIFFFCVNFVIFAVIPLVCGLFRRLSITLVEVLLLIFNYLLFLGLALSAALYYVKDKDFAAWLMLGTAIFTGVQYALLHLLKKEDRALSSVLSVMTFGSLALFVCLYFSRDWMNTALAVLAVSMLYTGARTANKVLVVLSWITCIVLGLNVFAYAHQLVSAYPRLAVERFFSLGIFAVALCACGILIRRSDPEFLPESRKLSAFFLTLAGIQFFYYSSVECCDLSSTYLPVFRNGALSVYWGLFALTLLLSGILRGVKALRVTALGLFIVCALKVFFVDLGDAGTLSRMAAFLAIGIVMILGAALYARFKERFENTAEEKKG